MQKTARKKHQIFEKWDHFENPPSCKGYSLCKILTLGQKLKLQKTYQNPFYKSFKVVLCKKTAPKKTKYSRNETVLKIGHYAKAIAFAKSSLWVKNWNSKKHIKIHSTNHLELFCAKNRSKKLQIFEKWDHFENWPLCKGYSCCKILTLGQKLKFKKHVKIHSTNHLELFCAKNRSKKHQIFEKWDHFENRPSCKGYSLCKILTFGQKLKFQKTCQNPFYKSFTVVLCKKLLEKAPNIREIRPFWKSAIIKRL